MPNMSPLTDMCCHQQQFLIGNIQLNTFIDYNRVTYKKKKEKKVKKFVKPNELVILD